MTLEYYSDTDMLYIRLSQGVSAESEEIAPGIVLDFDERGRVIGIEIEDAGKTVDLSKLELKGLSFVNLLLTEKASAPA